MSLLCRILIQSFFFSVHRRGLSHLLSSHSFRNLLCLAQDSTGGLLLRSRRNQDRESWLMVLKLILLTWLVLEVRLIKNWPSKCKKDLFHLLFSKQCIELLQKGQLTIMVIIISQTLFKHVIL